MLCTENSREIGWNRERCRANVSLHWGGKSAFAPGDKKEQGILGVLTSNIKRMESSSSLCDL